MNIKFTDNIKENLLSNLLPFLKNAQKVKFAVAFAKLSGLNLILEDLLACLNKGGQIEFLLGLDFRTTEPKVLEIIHSLIKEGENIHLFCYRDISYGETAIYHPKLYFLHCGPNAFVSIGSSNLTSGGLKDNIEINTILEAESSEEIVSDIHEIYNRLKFHRSRFEPDSEYITDYTRIYELTTTKSDTVIKDTKVQEMIKGLKLKERNLPSPKFSKNDLTGWQKIVFERLPDSEFQTKDIYVYKDEFQSVYPDNRHIPDKIRQVLQQLRDMNLLKDLGRGRWKKSEKII